MHIHLYIRLLRSAAACLVLSASALRRRRKQQQQQQQQQLHKSDDVDLHVLLRKGSDRIGPLGNSGCRIGL